MEVVSQERLKQAQVKVKNINSNRDKILGDARVEEQKLKQSYDNLRELGIVDPESKTVKELKTLEAEFKEQLEEKLTAIESHLTTGEELITKYNEIQGSN